MTSSPILNLEYQSFLLQLWSTLVKSSLCGVSEFHLGAVATSTLLGCYAALLPRRAKAASLQVFTILDCAKQLVLDDLRVYEMKCILLQKLTVCSRLPFMWIRSVQCSDCLLLLTLLAKEEKAATIDLEPAWFPSVRFFLEFLRKLFYFALFMLYLKM